MKIFETENFYVVGNNIALDFINSVMFDLTRENLLGWAIAVNLIEAEKAENLLQKWNEEQLAEVSDFRNNLRETIVKLANGKKIKQSEIDLLNKTLQETSGYPKLQQTPEGFVKRFEIDLSEPRKILVPIAESIVDLLCYGDLSYLRKCESETCILIFLRHDKKSQTALVQYGNLRKSRESREILSKEKSSILS